MFLAYDISPLSKPPGKARRSYSILGSSTTRPQGAFARLHQYLFSIIQEAPQLPAPRRMLQLPQRLGFDLPNTLSGHRELLADFFQGVVGVHADTEAHAQHAFLAWRQRRQNPSSCLAQVGLDRGVDRQD